MKAQRAAFDERVERTLAGAGWADVYPGDSPPGDDHDRRSRLAALEGPQPARWADVWARSRGGVGYLAAPLLARGEIARVYSAAKVGKSLLAMEVAAALSTGRPVLGGPAGDPVRVVYVDQENREGDWADRMDAMGYGPDDLDDLILFDLQSWPPLDTAAGGKSLLERVAVADPALVILDTFGKFIEGPEDKADTMLAVYRHTLAPLRRDGRAVFLLDHAGKDIARGARGSSSKADDVDTVWRLTTRGRDRLTLQRTHSRQRHEVDTLYLRRVTAPLRHEVETVDERAEELTGLALDAIRLLAPAEGTSARQVGEALRKDGQKWRDETIREALRRYVADHGWAAS